MKIDRKTLILCVACLLIGSWGSSTSAPDVGPFGPAPRPLDDRPVLKWIARAARGLLWISLMTEQPPKPEAQHLAKHYGDDQIDFGRGW